MTTTSFSRENGSIQPKTGPMVAKTRDALRTVSTRILFKKILLKNRLIKNNLVNNQSDSKPVAHRLSNVHDQRHHDLREGLSFDSSDFQAASIPISSAPLPVSRLIEQNIGLIIQNKSSLPHGDDINRLIKKLTLSFTATGGLSSFAIDEGVFKDCHFHLATEGNLLSLTIEDASDLAKGLVISHRDILQQRLSLHEINLHDVQFISQSLSKKSQF